MPDSSSMLNAAQLLAQAEQAYSAKNYPVAIHLYRRIIREHPQSVIAQTAQPRLAEAEKQHQLIVAEQERIRLTEVARQFTGKRNTDWTPIIVPLGEIIEGAKLPKMEMCLVPVGSFMMGEGSDAHPQTILKPYWMARYPVTNAQWRVAVEAGVVNVPRDVEWWYNDPKMADCPVVRVTWYQALAFARWVGCTLPGELETEYVARGVESWAYPWGNNWGNGRRAVWRENSGGKPKSVMSKPQGASWVGAMHLSGNVWEWQWSAKEAYPYKSDDGREDIKKDINYRVVRGGSFLDPAYFLRSANRYLWYPTDRINDIGFRCALS